MYRHPDSSSGISIESLFHDIYRNLEELKHVKDHADSITNCIVHCSREIRNLERIHGFGPKFYGTTVSEDPFELRDTLNKFITSCNALSYVSSPSAHSALDDDDAVGAGCLFPVGGSWRKKQMKNLDIEFLGLQRTLSLELSHAV